MRNSDWTKILGWPGYRVYKDEINEEAKALKLWVRRKRGNRKLVCSGCGRRVSELHESYEREVRDLPCFEFRTTVVIELYRVRCPDCGIKVEKVEQLPTKAPFSHNCPVASRNCRIWPQTVPKRVGAPKMMPSYSGAHLRYTRGPAPAAVAPRSPPACQ